MNVLEKVLEEIEERIKIIKNIPVNEDDDFLDGEECYEDGRTQGRFEELLWCRDIIFFHKDEINNDDWIPVEDRLPEEPKFMEEDSYIVQTEDIITPFSAYWDGKEWTDVNDEPLEGIIAWQPLPEPYRPKEKNNE